MGKSISTSNSGVGSGSGSGSGNAGKPGEKVRLDGKGGDDELTPIDSDKPTLLAPLTSGTKLSLMPKLNLGGGEGGGGDDNANNNSSATGAAGGKSGTGGDNNNKGGEDNNTEGGEGTSPLPSRMDKGHGPTPPPLKLDFSALSPGPQGVGVGVHPPASPSKGLAQGPGLMSAKGQGLGSTARTILPTARAPSKNIALALARKRRQLVLFPEDNDR